PYTTLYRARFGRQHLRRVATTADVVQVTDRDRAGGTIAKKSTTPRYRSPGFIDTASGSATLPHRSGAPRHQVPIRGRGAAVRGEGQPFEGEGQPSAAGHRLDEVDEGAERDRQVFPARVVQERPREARPPRFEHGLELPAVEVRAQPGLEQIDDAAAGDRGVHGEIGGRV